MQVRIIEAKNKAHNNKIATYNATSKKWTIGTSKVQYDGDFMYSVTWNFITQEIEEAKQAKAILDAYKANTKHGEINPCASLESIKESNKYVRALIYLSGKNSTEIYKYEIIEEATTEEATTEEATEMINVTINTIHVKMSLEAIESMIMSNAFVKGTRISITTKYNEKMQVWQWNGRTDHYEKWTRI